MKNITKMKAKREDLRLQAVGIITKAEAESRFLTDEENEQLKQFEEQIAKWDESIKRAKAVIALAKKESTDEREKDDEDEDDDDDEPEKEEKRSIVKPVPTKTAKTFRSFGEQLISIYRAASPGGEVDSRLSVRAASGLNETNPSDGGYLVETDFVTDILKKAYDTGLLASKAKKIPISSNANGLKIRAVEDDNRTNGSRWGGVAAHWEDEAEQLAGSKPKFRIMDLSLKKLTGLCYATDELLQDAAALESVVRQAFADEFGFKLDDAIIWGDGVGKPKGIMKSAALVEQAVESGQTEKITAENIVSMWSRLWIKSRATAEWYISQELEPQLYTLKIGGQPVYLPAGGLSDSPYGKLLGRPVIPIEQCAAAGAKGDIILADIGQYLLIDKGGINAASSIHCRFLYDESVFRFIYRVDGQPTWSKPITPYKGSSTLSPFITLAKRGA